MANVTIGASQISGFNANNIGADISLSGLTVTLNDDQVTGTFPQRIVGLGGFKITFSTGVTYTVESVTSTSALTLTSDYLESSGTVTATLHKFVHLRVYVLTPFTPSGETYVAQSGAPGSTAWYRRYAVPIINDGTQNVAYVPEIVLPATTDSSAPTARYFAGMYATGGAFIQAFPGCVNEFRLDDETTPTSWSQICEFNSPANPAPPQPENFYTAAEIDARFPSGSANQLLYFENTGNVLTPLSLSADFSISSDTLSLTGPSGVNRIQEEGANLPQRQTLNFVGTSFTAADDVANSRTNVTADADLDAIASNSTNGIYARTGAGTVSARTITGPAAGITVTNGDGVAGNPTLALANNLAALEAINTTGLIAQTAADTVTPRTITGTANRITVTNGDGVAGNPTLDIGANVATNGNNLSFFSSTTSAQLAGVLSDETGSGAAVFGTGPTLTSPRVVTSILDTNGNELAVLTATGSAVNEVTLANAATGTFPSIAASGNDSNIDLTLTPKGTGKVGVGTPGGSPVAGIVGAADASGTNTAGVNLNIHGGKGTGNAVPGITAFQYPLTTTSGTTLQSLSTALFPPWVNMHIRNNGDVTVTNTVTETSVVGASQNNSTKTIEAGLARAGRFFLVRCMGSVTTTGTPTLRVRLKLGSTTIGDTGAVTMANNTASGAAFVIEALVSIYTVGATGTVNVPTLKVVYPTSNGGAVNSFSGGAGSVGGTTTVDLTAAQTFDVTVQWGTASASNTVEVFTSTIEMSR